MAFVSNKEYWQRIAVELDQYYDEVHKKRPNKYFTYFSTPLPNPLAGIDPLHHRFFGPKVCIIFIIGKPFGATGPSGAKTFEWPPPGYDISKDHIKEVYNQWTKFELNFYADELICQKAVDADPEGGGEFKRLMELCFDQLESECSDMSQYGWNWRGRISEEVPASFFYPVLDPFYIS